MNKRQLIVMVIVNLLLLAPNGLRSQSYTQPAILFYQLNTAQGLSDNYVHDMCIDRSGILWIGTGEGLNTFNGKTVTSFFKEQNPQLQSDYMAQLVCDDDNRIWIRNADGLITMIDENRNFHRVALGLNNQVLNVRKIINTNTEGIVIFARDHFYSLIPGKNYAVKDSLTLDYFKLITFQGPDTAFLHNISQVELLENDNCILSTKTGLIKINFKTKRIEKKIDLPDLTILTGMNSNDVLTFNRTDSVIYSIDMLSGTATRFFENKTDQHGNKFSGRPVKALMQDNHQLWLTTAGNGLYLYSTNTGKLFNFKHSAADPTTISNNLPSVIVSDSSGWIFISNTPNGISYFKNNAVIGQQLVFSNDKGMGYDGYINSITTRDNDNYYIGISDNLLLWQRSTNTSRFIATEQNDKASFIKRGVGYLMFDNRNRLWVQITSQGIFVLDKENNTEARIRLDTAQGSSPNNNVRHMEIDKDNKFAWLSTRDGMFRVALATLKIDRPGEPLLAPLKKNACNRVWFQDSDNIWIGTESLGAWHYTFSSKKLEKFTLENGNPSNEIFCFNEDSYKNIYIGTAEGLRILFTNGTSKNITVKDGLLNKRVEALLRDKNDRIWIGNDVAICCFNIADTSIRVFDERYGLSVQGFRVNSYHQNSDGEQLWGTERGLQYFYPDNLWKQTVSLNTTINRIESRDVVSNVTENSSFDLSPDDNYLTFYFSAVDYSKHLRTFYEYKLEGVDEKWIKVTDQNFARYNAIPPGKYRFLVKASNDGKIWEEAKNTVSISIAKPLWQQTWFKILELLLVLLIIWLILNFSRQRIKTREEKQKSSMELLENKQKATESRLQNLRLQMNPHFLFNALNSIQQMILANEDVVATKYLSKFSRLLRSILIHSDKERITLKEEVEILNLYIELESIRFKESFKYKVLIDEDIESEEIKIPTLLVQPFVENAIWHGLMHKEGDRLLTVEFLEKGDFVKCIVEDNGIGRQKAAEMKMKSGSDKNHTSKGIAVSKERLKTLRAKDGREGDISIIDLENGNGEASGTRVEINFPIQN